MSDEDNKPHDGQTGDHGSPRPEPLAEPAAPAHEPSSDEGGVAHAEAEHEADAGHHEAEPHDAGHHDAEPHAAHDPVEAAHPEPEPTPVPADSEPVSPPEPEPAAPADPDPAPAADPEPIAPEPEPEPELEPGPASDPEFAPLTDAEVHTGDEVHASTPEPIADPEPAHETPAVDPALAAAGVAAVGATAAAAASRPIWSDNGDAPFDEPVPETRRDAKARGRREEKEKGGFFSELFDIIRTVVYALLIALVVRVFFFQPFTIPSASMEPNLYEGDYIVVSKWSYGYSRHSVPWSPPIFEGRLLGQDPARGDIVVFKRPNNDGRGYTDYIKRVIGLPGDTVQMISNRLYINGEQVQDVVVEAAQVRGAFQGASPIQLRETLPGGHEFRIQDFGPGSPSDDTDEFTIPAGHYFVMGDNRDDSMDSRYVWEAGGVGLVPHENLVGKAQVILFSWTPGASLLNPVSWFANIRTERFFTDLE
jgi:signal peptidase I